MLFNLNSLLPPVFGGFMYDKFGFRITMYISMTLMAIISLIFGFVNMGCSPYKNDAVEQ